MSFEIFNVTRIVFGAGQVTRLSEFVPATSRVLLVYNGSDELAARIGAILSEPPILFRQKGEPTVADIDRVVALGRLQNANFILGAGGGSAIDCAKAVAGLLATGKPVTDYLEVVGKGEKITKIAVPWIAIPTTAGTGAEVTRNAVVGWPEKKFKASIRSELLLPRAAIIDPELALNVPPNVTAASGMDALCQCIEAYVSKNANPMTDAIAIKGVELAGKHLQRAYDNGQDLEARSAMAEAALFSGIALTNAGLGAVHGFAAPMGANFPIPHGVICGLLLPHVIRENRIQAVTKYADIDRALGADAERFCSTLLRQLKLPSLPHFGFKEHDIAPMVDLAKRASSMRYNPVALSDDALADVLRQSIGRASSLRVRNFTPADASAFRSLNEEWLTRYFHIEPKDIKVLSDPVTQIIDPGGEILILERAGQTIGCCALVKLKDQTLELAKMAVTQAEQGKGAGKFLLQAAIDRARAVGASRLYLESNSKLEPALTLYRNLGFTDVPKNRVPPSEYSRVDVWMELNLNR